MRRCPTCNKTFTDQSLSFCVEDGTPLVSVEQPESASSAAEINPERRAEGASDWKGASYQPSGTYALSGGGTRRRTWPWVLGISIVVVVGILSIVGILITAKVLLTRSTSTSLNRNSPIGNANSGHDNERSDRNSGSDGASNTNTSQRNDIVAPTDKEEVLAQLTALEHEWTAANLNADKKKLSSILADDYVGTSGEGKTQGKAEYIRTIVRDTTVQKWDFEDLKLSLRGDRATLTGRVRLRVQDKDAAFKFTDKFVWRDGRWQATGSEVTPEQQDQA